MGTESTILLLFVVASAVAVVARRLHFPYTVALVLAGLALGAIQLLKAPTLTRDVLFLFFLPGLIFEAAYNIRFSELWRDRMAVLSLAIPGVALTIGVTALLLVYASEMMQQVPDLSVAQISWTLALLFGAAVAATDPISVISLFERLGVPRRLTLLIKGESLLNDGTAIVFFNLVLAVLLGASTSTAQLTWNFFSVVGGGIMVGGLLGLLISQALRHIDDAMVAITLTTVAAYGSFLLADQMGWSGVISTVVAALICGNYGTQQGLSPSLRVAADSFWEYMGFVLNSLVFLLMGLEIRLDALLATWPIILLAYLAMTLARAVVVSATGGLLAWTPARIPRKWMLVLSWGGLRGALSMVLVLSLPEAVPLRETLVNMVFGVVLLSILIQGLSITPLARRLGLLSERESLTAYEVARASLRLAADVLVELSRRRKTGLASVPVLDILEAEYRQRLGEVNSRLEATRPDPHLQIQEELTQLRRRLLQFEKEKALDDRKQGMLGLEAFRQLNADIDARLLQLETNESTGALPQKTPARLSSKQVTPLAGDEGES